MKLIWGVVTLAASVSFAPIAYGQAPSTRPAVGEAYEITKSYKTLGHATDGSSSSSSGQDTLIERIIGVRDDGLELEYDLPGDATADEKSSQWQFPARVFRPASGAMQLLNSAELEARLEDWLKAAGWTRAICGRWIFTWNAFRIECDPQSVIQALHAIDLRAIQPRDGSLYREPEARTAGTLERTATGPSGATFAVMLDIDPDAVRRARAETDVVVGHISGEPVTLEAALRDRAKERVTGTISVTFETDAAGNVWRRIRLTSLTTERRDGVTETETNQQVVERQLVLNPR